jgi:signal transduction histidine kinase
MLPVRARGAGLRHAVQVSLRVRILVFVAVINTAVFGAGAYYFSYRVRAERERATRDFTELLPYSLRPTVSEGGKINAAELLRWPIWKNFEDALIVYANWNVGARGEIQPVGAYLNPLGRSRRPPEFDEQSILRSLAECVRTQRVAAVYGGLAVPVLDPEGRVWGGCWFVLPSEPTSAPLFRLLPWFLASTLLLTLGTFAMLRRFVLDPVENLARGARQLAQGELSTRLAVPERRDELSELIRGFNQMAETVEGFNARLAREVEVATETARRAETAAMTQRRLAATGELAAGIAHEINNPLGGLLNAVETLAKPELPPAKRAQYVELVRHGLERIQRTVGQLLRFTPRAPHAAPVALVEPVLDAVGLVSWRARQQQVAIELAGVDALGADRERVLERVRALPLVRGDAPELAQAVLNLLVNALDALASQRTTGGHIRIGLEQRGDTLVLAVEDDGPGVPPELLPRIADLFFTTKDVGKGTGLGLSIVHNVAAAHGARVLLSNVVSGGLRVEIVFPATASGRGGAVRS